MDENARVKNELKVKKSAQPDINLIERMDKLEKMNNKTLAILERFADQS